jgi:predicted transcriptional regulator
MDGKQLIDEINNIQTNVDKYNAVNTTVNDQDSIYEASLMNNLGLAKSDQDKSLQQVILDDQYQTIGNKDAINMVAIVAGISLIIFSVMALSPMTK